MGHHAQYMSDRAGCDDRSQPADDDGTTVSATCDTRDMRAAGKAEEMVERQADGTHSGDDVLDWLRTPDARAVAQRFVHRRRLPGGQAMVDDVLSDASLAVLHRVRSTTPLAVNTPGGYGTAVIRSVTRSLLQGHGPETDRHLEPWEDPPQPPVEAVDPTVADGVRTTIERLGSDEPWLTSAALTYVTLVLHPGSTPEALPAPKAGANERQARCWPALWIAGEHAVFPESGHDPNRRTRARRITKVLARIDVAFDSIRLGLDHSHKDGHELGGGDR